MAQAASAFYKKFKKIGEQFTVPGRSKKCDRPQNHARHHRR